LVELHGLECKLKWEMMRDIQRKARLQENVEENEIRQRRWKDSDELKAHASEKARTAKHQELEARRHVIDHKREAKQRLKVEHLEHQQELLAKTMAHSALQEEHAARSEARRREPLEDKRESLRHVVEERQTQKMQAKLQEQAERAHEHGLEMARVARQLSEEKERRLRAIEHWQSAKKGVPRPIPLPAHRASASPQPRARAGGGSRAGGQS